MEDERLKQLLRKLGDRINSAVEESEQVDGTIEELRDLGYDVYLVLEATFSLGKLSVNTSLTDADKDLLKALKIQYPENET